MLVIDHRGGKGDLYAGNGLLNGLRVRVSQPRDTASHFSRVSAMPSRVMRSPLMVCQSIGVAAAAFRKILTEYVTTCPLRTTAEGRHGGQIWAIVQPGSGFWEKRDVL